MPSTYTLNNGIELIATGEQSGTWGDTTNTNFQLLDTSLDGQVTVTLASTGSSGSPNTLPVSDGAASNGRNRLVIFDDSSDLGGTAFVQLTPSDAEKIIYVRNSLSGSRSILLFQGTYSASNDYEVPAGTTAVVFFNGAGSGAVAANVFNNAHFDNLNIVGNISLTSDGSVINIGADNDLQITHSGSAGTITNATGGFTIDSAANIILDPDGGNVLLKDNGVEFGRFNSDSGDLILYTDTQNKHIILKGNDGGSAVNALDLDMENAGFATFNAGVVINNSGGEHNFQVKSDDNADMFRVSGAEDKVMVGTSSTSTQTVETGYVAKLNVKTGVNITHDLQASSEDRYPLNLASPGSWATNGNVGTYTSLRWSNNPSQQMGEIGLRYGSAQTTTGAASEVSIRGLFNTNYGNSGEIVSFGANKLMVHQGGAIFNESGSSADFRVESDGNSHMLFVDAGENAVKIGGTSTREGQLQIFTNASGVAMEIESTNGTASQGPILQLRRTSASPAGNDYLGALNFVGQDSGDNALAYVDMYTRATTITDGSEESQFTIRTRRNGNLEERFTLNAVETTFNEVGGDIDFRVESDTNTHMLFVNAGLNRVGIGESGPLARLHLKMGGSSRTDGFYITRSDNDNHQLGLWTSGGVMYYDAFTDNPNSSGQFRLRHSRNTGSTITESIFANDTNVVINDGSVDMDFRVESDNSTHALFVNAAVSRVGIKTASPDYELQVGDDNTNVDATIAVASAGSSEKRLVFYRASNKDWEIVEDTSENLSINSSGITGKEFVINNASNDTDFRVESNDNANMLFVDAGTNAVGIATGSTTSGRGELGIGGMLFFEPGGTAWSATNPRPTIKREADGQLRLSSGSDSNSRMTFYTAPSSGGSLVQRMELDRNGVLFAPRTIRSFNNSSVYHSMHTDAVSLPNSTDTIVATLTKTGYAYYLAGQYRLVIYDTGSPWGIYNYVQTISGKTSTYTGGGMGVGLGTAEIVSRLDYTPTVSLVDNRATGGESTATWQIKVNPGTSGPATALTIFTGYMAGATWT